MIPACHNNGPYDSWPCACGGRIRTRLAARSKSAACKTAVAARKRFRATQKTLHALAVAAEATRAKVESLRSSRSAGGPDPNGSAPKSPRRSGAGGLRGVFQRRKKQKLLSALEDRIGELHRTGEELHRDKEELEEEDWD